MEVEEKLDQSARQFGRELLDSLSTGGLGRFFSPDEQLLDWVIDRPNVKTSLFRLVDVLPALDDPDDVVDHLRAYLDRVDRSGELPRWIRWGLKSSELKVVPNGVVSRAANWSVKRLADRFIAGSTLPVLESEVQKLEEDGFTVSIDRLGEAVLADSEARDYRKAYLDILRGLDEFPATELARKRRRSLSVKLTALDSQFDPVAREATLDRLEENVLPILEEARKRNVIVYFDMEEDFSREVTLALARRLLNRESLAEWEGLGLVIQAYHKESRQDCRELLEWCEANDRRLWIRLVKGAYWDSERIRSYRNNWDVPVFESKGRTDDNFEAIARMLGEFHPVVKPAFGSHNVRSLAYGVSVANHYNLPRRDWELQMLYGMGQPIQDLMNDYGHPVRLYVPYGELLPGMAYLVRRLLENTSNQSFLRQTFHESDTDEDLLDRPDPDEPAVDPPRREGYRSVGPRNFSREETVSDQEEGLQSVYKKLGMDYPLRLEDRWESGDEWIDSRNPSRKNELVGRVARAGEHQVEQALSSAAEAFEKWRETPVTERAEWLENFGERLERDRRELASWVIFENGKNWREADADVMEAVDFCYYYAEKAREIGKGQHWDWPGEDNRYDYEPRGPTAVIPPWNFPLAILTGMTTAALVTGNPVLLKPSSRTPVIAYQFVKRAVDSGLPDGVLQLLPGSGSRVGRQLVEDPRTTTVAFTGSREVGLDIHRRASVTGDQEVIKKTILEMGGKNAIIVDTDADLDEALEGIVKSAFGYQGQKCSACSRVLLPDSFDGSVAERLVEAVDSLRIGPARDPANFLGPVIARDAAESIRGYQDQARHQGTVLLSDALPDGLPEGHYVSPMIVDEVDPSSAVAQEEIFGPVLPIIRYSDLDEALEIANNVPYALTGGFYSRHPDRIDRVKKEFRVGNLYVNQTITGAVVGRQPFGGFKLSGTGTKAGGPDYLKNFLWPRSTSEETVRRGFSPDEYL